MGAVPDLVVKIISRGGWKFVFLECFSNEIVFVNSIIEDLIELYCKKFICVEYFVFNSCKVKNVLSGLSSCPIKNTFYWSDYGF